MGLDVNPNVYYEAAKKLSTLTEDINTAVARDLVPGLAAGLGMCGNYPAVASWNASYQRGVGEVRTAILAYAAALQHFSDILDIAGYNWDAAEYNANPSPGKGVPPHPVLADTTPVAANSFPEAPNSSGDNGPGVVILAAGQNPSSWTGAPNGRADALEAAAKTWETFGFSQELLNSPAALRAVHDTFVGVQAPEVPDILEALLALQGGADEIGSVAQTLGFETRLHYDYLIEARADLSTAAAGAFPSHPSAQVMTVADNTSVRVSVNMELSAVDITNAQNILGTKARDTRLFGILSQINSTTGIVDSDALSTLPKLQALMELPLLVESGNQNDNTALIGDLARIASWKTPAAGLTVADLSALDQYGPQMKNWAILAVKYGNEAGVDPRLVLAMALQEGAPLRTGLGTDLYSALQDPSTYKADPNGPLAGKAWDDARLLADRAGVDKGHGAGNSIGLTNQKKDPFNEAKTKYPIVFEGENWSDLAGNDELALKAAAYNLRILTDEAASQATPAVRESQELNQFLGSGYNAGGTLGRSLEVAEGRRGFEDEEVEHGQSTVSVVELANKILVGSGAFL